MSLQAARDYLKKIKTDQALQEKVKAATDLEARQRLIKAAGFDFTLAEYRQAIEGAAAAAGKELTAEQLEAVAGGLGIPERGKFPGEFGIE
ncbi:MAG: Nif11-like leader peptide family RiPP precursor [Syntrophales bacterium]|nr:Nif11-like leader peptide family RiPP precursor [Syntrophales bacterium]MDD5640210.1 Nif11-like leader peptide family RiPP precursor [Syntrophales bacterium]